MGERAIAVVYSGDTAHWYRSQWGGAQATLDGVFAAVDPFEPLLEPDWHYLESGPLSSLERELDFHTTSALYLVSHDGVGVYLPLWFGLGVSDTSFRPECGLLVPVHSSNAVSQCRFALRRFKELLLETAGTRTLTPELTQDILDHALELVRTIRHQFHPVPNIYIR